ncbi:LamG-like jellyroll fold domain-containing protein [Limibacter armeniacum]|uniref:LamG-like jellyroll fold domain-containing protein n=1 Tax=Limibacter armeniacum TaxID=466084 RepID=UPI002FE64F8D
MKKSILLLLFILPVYLFGQQPILHLPFDENAKDVINGTEGKVRGAIFNDGFRCTSGAYSFNGNDHVMEIPAPDKLNKVVNGLSVSVWVRPESDSDDDIQMLLGRWGKPGQTEQDQFGLFLSPSNKLLFAVSNGVEAEVGVYGKTSLYAKEWHHIVAVWEFPNKISLYINGKLERKGLQKSQGINQQSTLPIRVGRQELGLNRAFRGAIDQVKIFDKALSEEEINKLHFWDNAPCNSFYLEGTVFNQATGEAVTADVTVKDIDTGEEMATATITDPERGYEVFIPVGPQYIIYAQKDGFVSISDSLNSANLYANTFVRRDLYLVPLEAGQVVKLKNLFFDFAKATLRPNSYTELNRLLQIFTLNPGLKVEIAGHTDNVGSDAANQQLSEARANAVRKYLLSKGISPNSITAKGYGENSPVDTNDTDEGRQQNRRVEFRIISAEQ